MSYRVRDAWQPSSSAPIPGVRGTATEPLEATLSSRSKPSELTSGRAVSLAGRDSIVTPRVVSKLELR